MTLSTKAVLFVAFFVLGDASPQDLVPNKHRYVLAIKNNWNAKIVGGVEVVPHSYPHQAGLFIHTPNGTFICGGSLVSRRYVLTAAHCLDDAEKVDVILGAHNMYDKNEPGQIHVTTKKFVKHEDWNEIYFLNDIAVLELPYSINLTKTISPIDLPTYSQINQTFVNESAVTIGWGKTSDDIGGVTEVLKSVTVNVATNKYCDEVFGIIKDMHICTCGEEIKGTCMGDSGGPLLIGGKLVGIVSFGSTYCELGLPSAFTRVTYFLDWLKNHTDVTIAP